MMNLIKIFILILISVNIPLVVYSRHLINERNFVQKNLSNLEKNNNKFNQLYKIHKKENINYKNIKKQIKFVYNQECIFQIIKRQANINDCNITGMFEEKADTTQSNVVINYCYININIESDIENNVFDLIKDISKFLIIKIEKIEFYKADTKITANILLKVFFKN